jgi:hypothetical protein
MDHSRRSEVDTDQMISTAPDISADETTRFTCEAQHLDVECSPPVLRAICAAAAKGASQLRRGGLEVGGILLGRREGNVVRVLATRSIKCEYRFGPSFVLSDNDRVMLEQSLNRLQLEPDLAALEPVGCYYSHSRHGADLTPSDIDVWNKYFPRPFQIALVLVPGSGASTQITAFVRDPRGNPVLAHQFDKTPSLERERTTFGSSRHTEARRSEMLPAPAAELRPPLDPILFHTPEPARRRFPVARIVLLGILLMLAAVAVVVVFGWPPAIGSQASVTIPVTITGADRILNIRWAPIPAGEGTTGRLEIRDGAEAPVYQAVTAQQLREGGVTYTRRSGKVEVRFALARNGRDISGVSDALYVGPAGEEFASSATETIELPAETIVAKNTAPSQTLAPASPRTEPKRFSAPAIPPAIAAAFKPLPLLTAPDEAPVGPSASPTISTVLPQLKLSPAPAPPAAVPAPVAAAPATPRAGRLIWTGQLRGSDILSISGNRASAGFMNGSLPGAPITIQAHPAELIAGGMIVFTQNMVAGPEAPGPDNGWNLVSYKSDPKRATDLKIRELPSAANQWNRIVLETGSRPVSVIVLDWSRRPE